MKQKQRLSSFFLWLLVLSPNRVPIADSLNFQDILKWLIKLAETFENEELRKILETIAQLYKTFMLLFEFAKYIDPETMEFIVLSFNHMIKELAFLLFDNRMSEKMSEAELKQEFANFYTTAREYLDKMTQEFDQAKKIFEETVETGTMTDLQKRKIAMHLQKAAILRSGLDKAFELGKEKSRIKLDRLKDHAWKQFLTATGFSGLGALGIVAAGLAGFTVLPLAAVPVVGGVVSYQWYVYQENIKWLDDLWEATAGQEEIFIYSRQAEFSDRQENYEESIRKSHAFMADFAEKMSNSRTDPLRSWTAKLTIDFELFFSYEANGQRAHQYRIGPNVWGSVADEKVFSR